jgi:hypothetical protein
MRRHFGHDVNSSRASISGQFSNYASKYVYCSFLPKSGCAQLLAGNGVQARLIDGAWILLSAVQHLVLNLERTVHLPLSSSYI